MVKKKNTKCLHLEMQFKDSYIKKDNKMSTCMWNLNNIYIFYISIMTPCDSNRRLNTVNVVLQCY